MRVFRQLENVDILDVVEESPFVPQKLVNGSLTMKRGRCHTTTKVMHILYCFLSKSQFNKVQQCSKAQEIWQTLEVAYEGTSQFKENKISLLIYKYELFKMNEDESIMKCLIDSMTSSMTSNLLANHKQILRL